MITEKIGRIAATIIINFILKLIEFKGALEIYLKGGLPDELNIMAPKDCILFY
jgi:hypothetical protein